MSYFVVNYLGSGTELEMGSIYSEIHHCLPITTPVVVASALSLLFIFPEQNNIHQAFGCILFLSYICPFTMLQKLSKCEVKATSEFLQVETLEQF